MAVDLGALPGAFSRALRRRHGALPTAAIDSLNAALTEALRELAAKAAETSVVTFVGEADPVHRRAVELLADVAEPATEANYVDAVEVASARRPVEVAGDPLSRRLARGSALHNVAADRLGDDYTEAEYLAELDTVGREVGLNYYDAA